MASQCEYYPKCQGQKDYSCNQNISHPECGLYEFIEKGESFAKEMREEQQQRREKH